LSATQAGPFSGADIGRCAMSPAPSVSQFKSFASAHQPGLMLYDYSADEIGHCTNLYPTIRQWAKNMHQAGIKNLISMSPTPALYDDGAGRSAVDIWVLLPVMYNNSRTQVGEVLKKRRFRLVLQHPGTGRIFTQVVDRFRPGQLPRSAGLYQPEPQPERIALLADRQMVIGSVEQCEQCRLLQLG